ncbi:MAG: cupin domain-containing protein [Candidatus Paceibacterota bacterium]|jgi:mannose-6-phosphate isomerase-like protein (cupin superfamily)
MKKGFVSNIEQDAINNNNFRKVLYTSKNGQVVVMSLLPSEEIGMEVHPDNDQFFRIDSGEGKVIIDGEEALISDGFAVVVPAGSMHNVINTSNKKSLKLYTIYMPPHHKDGVIHKTKADAEIAETDGSDVYIA